MKNIKTLGTLMTTHGYTNDSISLADVPASRRDNKGNIKPHCLPKSDNSSIPNNDFTNIFGVPNKKSDYSLVIKATNTRFIATDVAKTEQLLEKLAERMAFPFDWQKKLKQKPDCVESIRENPDIPAGYTYLGQFIAHDLVKNSAPFSDIDERRISQTDFRKSKLTLETIYGGGPTVCPFAYQAPQDGKDRSLFRFGSVQDDLGSGDFYQKRDLPRGQKVNLRGGGRHFRDVYIADARNDDHLFISQLSVAFSSLHNTICAMLRNLELDNAHLCGTKDGSSIFHTAQKITVFIYRKIITEDFLDKVLKSEIYQLYKTNDFKPLSSQSIKDQRMPLEFSHAAFRLGHMMVRNKYKINEDLKDAGLGKGNLLVNEALKISASSLKQEDLLPLKSSWLVDWANFFERSQPPPNCCGKTPCEKQPSSRKRPQPSFRISPSMAERLHHHRRSKHEEFSLVYKDLKHFGFNLIDIQRL